MSKQSQAPKPELDPDDRRLITNALGKKRVQNELNFFNELEHAIGRYQNPPSCSDPLAREMKILQSAETQELGIFSLALQLNCALRKLNNDARQAINVLSESYESNTELKSQGLSMFEQILGEKYPTPDEAITVETIEADLETLKVIRPRICALASAFTRHREFVDAVFANAKEPNIHRLATDVGIAIGRQDIQPAPLGCWKSVLEIIFAKCSISGKAAHYSQQTTEVVSMFLEAERNGRPINIEDLPPRRKKTVRLRDAR